MCRYCIGNKQQCIIFCPQHNNTPSSELSCSICLFCYFECHHSLSLQRLMLNVCDAHMLFTGCICVTWHISCNASHIQTKLNAKVQTYKDSINALECDTRLTATILLFATRVAQLQACYKSKLTSLYLHWIDQHVLWKAKSNCFQMMPL